MPPVGRLHAQPKYQLPAGHPAATAQIDSDFMSPSVITNCTEICSKSGLKLRGPLLSHAVDHHHSCSLRRFTCVDCPSSSHRNFQGSSPQLLPPRPTRPFKPQPWIPPRRMRPVTAQSGSSAMAPAIGVWQTLRRHVCPFPRLQIEIFPPHPALHPATGNEFQLSSRSLCTSLTAQATRQTRSSFDNAAN